MFFSISVAANYLGVSISTLRRWHHENLFLPDFVTPGGHRRYSLAKLKSFVDEEDCSLHSEKEKNTVIYARVSSAEQKQDLSRQASRLVSYCKEKRYQNLVTITDLGSGINYKKPGLIRLMKLLLGGQVHRLILFHKDRLLRFGSELIFKVCAVLEAEVEIFESEMDQSFEQELAADVIEIITVFSARLYGRRAHQNKINFQEGIGKAG